MRNSVYLNAKNTQQYSASTGFSLLEFETLHSCFSEHYQVPFHDFPSDFGNEYALCDSRESLFFILYHLKTNVTYEVLGLCFGISKSSAHKNVARIKPYLHLALQIQSVLPTRLFRTSADFEAYFEGIEVLCIDATETPIQRPQDVDNQKDSFSVKQHQNGVKNTIISDQERYIHFVGKTTWAGSTHDYQLLKEEFNPTSNFFK